MKHRCNPVLILVILTVIFCAAAVFLGYIHAAETIVDRMWGAFEGVLGAFLLILKADSDVPANPTQLK